MALGVSNGNQNEWKEKSMNTKSFTFYNKNNEHGSMLLMGFWNSCLTLKIHPIIPESRRNGSKMFDMETFINTALTPEKAIAMAYNLSKVVAQLEDGNYDFKSFGVPIGSGFVEISNGEKFGGARESLCITIYSNIDENGRTDEKLSYFFNTVPTYLNYDSTAGGSDLDINACEGEFLLFYRYVLEGIKANTNAVAHSIRNSNKYAYEKENSNIAAIMTKLGISTESYSSNNSGNKSSGFFGSGNKIQSNSGNGLEEKDISYGELADNGRLPI